MRQYEALSDYKRKRMADKGIFDKICLNKFSIGEKGGKVWQERKKVW